MPLLPSYRDFVRLEGKVDLALAYLRQNLNLEKHMSKDLDDLEAAVTAENTVIDSALKLLDELNVKITEAGTDANKLRALTAEIGERRDALAASVAKNTPAETEVPPTAAAPSISSVSPSTGAVAGGDVLSISGSGFTGASDVSIGGNPGTNLTVNSDTSISVTSPAGTAGDATVVVTTPAGASAPGMFTYA